MMDLQGPWPDLGTDLALTAGDSGNERVCRARLPGYDSRNRAGYLILYLAIVRRTARIRRLFLFAGRA